MEAFMYEAGHNWGWIFTIGCLLIVLGIMAVMYSMLYTIVSVLVLGWLLILGGVLEAVHAFQHRESGHLFLFVLEALLAVVTGVLLLRSPAVGALVITLLLATYFIISGIFRIVAATALLYPSWQWSLVHGVVTLALGIIVWGGWPATGFWVLGLLVGIHFIVSGWVRVMLALALRSGKFEAIPAH
jgi:uncharacterized membrane protein HdeD (DUF308 family)